MNIINTRSTISITLAISLFSFSTLASADDTEVFLTSRAKPNLLLIMDLSGSMGSSLSSFSSKTRFDVMKESINSVLEEAPDDINIGLMNYGPGLLSNLSGWLYRSEHKRSHGVHGVTFPVTGVNELALPIVQSALSLDNLPNPGSNTTVRTYLSEIIDSWSPNGGTPIVDSLVEASRYFAGDKMVFGQDLPSSVRGSHPSTYEGSPVTRNLLQQARNITQSPHYESPITNGCQENFIALLSDGEPSHYYLSQSYWTWGQGIGPFASYMKGNSNYGTLAAGINNCVSSPNGLTSGTCGSEVTRYMATKDMNSSIDGIQTVKTFTIGYSSGVSSNTQDYLKSLVTIEDDDTTDEVEGYYSADDKDSLVDAFQKILTSVTTSAESLGSPSYSVNVLSGLEHEDEIYIPLFSKASGVRWSGNLKKFSLVEGTSTTTIKGKNNLNAFDEDGQFTDNALDFWSANTTEIPDGATLEKGGVANLLNPNDRNLFSNINCTSATCDLNVADNKISVNNTKLTDDLLGISSDDESINREALINFIRGKNIDGTPRNHMGDILHSEPLVITYNASESAKEQYIFTGTNEGYLHAFDTTTGEEVFAFMPKELLGNIEPQYHNLDGNHIYGIDGIISYWQDQTTNKRYLYFGMRRGGTSYYALDITDIDNPKLLWKKSADDFPSMGQSWSPPYLDKVGIGTSSTQKEVVIISGGYDPVEDRNVSDVSVELDSSTKSVSTTVGKDILILDAKTGAKIWSLQDSVGSSQIENSIPGGVNAIDTNGNNIIDRMYFADTGGNVWRVDLSETIGSSDSEDQLTKFASLGGTGINSRKFFAEPDVAAVTYNGKKIYLITLGSGFRPHPLDTAIDDKFFILVDESPFSALSDEYDNIEITDLAKINLSISGTEVNIATEGSFKTDDKLGWEVSLPETGEKVLTKAFVRNGVVIFTTFVPQTEYSTCATSAGSVSHLYAINVITGESGVNFDEDSRIILSDQSITHEDISPRLSGTGYPGIISPPESVYGSFELDDEGICKHPVDYRLGRKLSPVSGYSACDLESVYWSNPVKN